MRNILLNWIVGPLFFIGLLIAGADCNHYFGWINIGGVIVFGAAALLAIKYQG